MKRKLRTIISIWLCVLLGISNVRVYAYAAAEDPEEIVLISTSDELMNIGSGNADDVASDGGSYYLTQDIEISYEELLELSLTEFNGTLGGAESEASGLVYDDETDTIYLHNVYQLELVLAGEEPVLSQDYDAHLIGTGHVYRAADALLTYDEGHNYVLASDFSLDRPRTLAEESAEEPENEITDEPEAQISEDDEDEQVEIEPVKVMSSMQTVTKQAAAAIASGTYPAETDGRDYFGEVVRTIDGEDYILIGDQQQLRAIGTNRAVTEPIWAVYEERSSTLSTNWYVVEDDADHPITVFYPGDADLIRFADGTDWSDRQLYAANHGGHDLGDHTYPEGGGALTETKRYTYCGSKLLNGNLSYDESKTTRTVNIGPSATYSYDANYIIFRDIFLTEDGTDETETVAWDPIDSFTGIMEGRRGMVEGENPVIHNVEILQDVGVDQRSNLSGSASEYGIGFFRSLITPYDNVLSVSNDIIRVKNITLDEVSVDTSTTQIRQDFSLVGEVLTPLLRLLGMTSGVEEDRKSLATGAFVGVVRGKVEISGCQVTNLDHVNNANDWTGGFVGYASGITQYEALSGVLGSLVGTLQTVLNIVPVLGLGDLIGVLANGGVLDVKDLIPVAYTNAVFSDNSVSYRADASVMGQKHTGGFAGETAGTVFENCDVEKADALAVSGTDYVGGFAGNTENVVITGLLTELGVDVIGNFPVNSTMLDCDITGEGTLNVTASAASANSGYAGGFVGRMANSYAVDCSVAGLGTVRGHDYVGGFAGCASDGALLEAGTNEGLVNIVRELLSGILNGNTSAQLLNLIGLRPSVITGVALSGEDVTIAASGRYAGGVVGYAGALQISNTDALNDSGKMTSEEVGRVLSANAITYPFGSNGNVFSSDHLTVSSTDCAGGAIGRGEMTGVAGVLDGTVSAVNYTRFELSDLELAGGEITVTSDNAGGVIGSGVGGAISDVQASGLCAIRGASNAGGFGGTFGSGTLANVGGINLLGLNVLSVDSLATVGEVIETFANDCTVSGIASGFTVSGTEEAGVPGVTEKAADHAGGFIGLCVSGKTNRCSVSGLGSVYAADEGGCAGGFIGRAKAGDAVSTIGGQIETDKELSGVQISNLLGIVSALTPEFHASTLTYTTQTGDQVRADFAGGFIGDGEAIDVNYSVNHKEGEGADGIVSTEITNLGMVHGFTCAGGFAGRLEPGDIAQTGSVNLLGMLSVSELLTVMDVAYPRISHAGITGDALTVIAEGKDGVLTLGDAGGFIGNGKAVIVEHSDLTELLSVTGGWHAGGYIGYMHAGTAANAGDSSGALLNSVLGMILNVNQLAAVIQAAGCDLKDCMVRGVSDGFVVEAFPREGNDLPHAQGYAGGYVGEMQSGHLDNSENAPEGEKGIAVENLKQVRGYRYAGGFGGKVHAGAVIELGDNLSVLTGVASATGLLSLIRAFVPEITDASVHAVARGCTVYVTGTHEADDTGDEETGSAGGYIGYGCGIRLTRSDVCDLKHTTVKEPADLQAADGSIYYGTESTYAVEGYRSAGGYFGKLDIGSTASIGGTNVLNKLVSLTSVASALEVVRSDVSDCDTFGATGGFNVRSTNETEVDRTGDAGGFAGSVRGGRLSDCSSYNFAHIIGRVSAGGYVGTAEPGALDRSVDDLDLLAGLITANNLLGVLRSFVPEIINSETTCIPCGGVVRADAASGDGVYRGLAGGYAGYNFGAQIRGMDAEEPEPKENAAIRIRSVYGYEYAGGYTGLMQCANVADSGSLNALFGLIHLDNPLTLLQAVYPTEEHTAVYGPLRQMSRETWNRWVGAVAKYGPYGETLQAIGPVATQEQLLELIDEYAYGYAVTGGRAAVAQTSHEGSAAGGYVGRMEGGTITNGYGYDLRLAEAYRAAGGFAGEMTAADVANVGGISLAGIDVTGNLPLLQTFVPVIKTASVDGYRSGAVVRATGADENNLVGVAGGYVGAMTGGQIWGRAEEHARVTNLRSVSGTSYVGGFVGRAVPGSALNVNTASDTGLLHKLLSTLIGTTDDLAEVLNATICTIRYVDVTAWDPYGLTVNGAYAADGADVTAYAKAAGGFAGMLSGAVVGLDGEAQSGFAVRGLRKVIGGEYAGGGVGFSDASDVAEISVADTTIAALIQTGSIDLLRAFRTYIYHANVYGSGDAGLQVAARTQAEEGVEATHRYHGSAGGFAGSLRDGTVRDAHVYELSMVEAMNNAGGFAGFTGKGGAIEVSKLEVLGNQDLNLLGGSLGLIDVFGSQIGESSVDGRTDGYVVLAEGGEEPVAGGFAGYGDLAHISGSTASDLGRVESDGIAGGFIGKTDFAYAADIQLNSAVVEFLAGNVLNPIIRALYLADGTAIDLPEIDLGLIKIGLLYENDLVSLNLLGLPIRIGLTRASETDEGVTDLAVINIGDSVIKLPAGNDGIIDSDENKENLRISLIKANRTVVSDSEVRGVTRGYDVTGTQLAGGFVGRNDDGRFENSEMVCCDNIIAGEAGIVGPYSASSTAEGQYAFENVRALEGNNNRYRVYRESDASDIRREDGSVIAAASSDFGNYRVYDVTHLQNISAYAEFEDATIGGAPLDVYITAQHAVLMDGVQGTYGLPDSDTPLPSSIDDICDETRDLTINKIWVMHYDREHPDSIHVTIRRSYTIGGEETTEVVPEYEDLVIRGASTARTWQYIVRGLPVYKELDGNGDPIYYHYTVTERELPAFETAITQTGGTFTVTNTQRQVVPTGYESIYHMWPALLLALLVFFVLRKRARS